MPTTDYLTLRASGLEKKLGAKKDYDFEWFFVVGSRLMVRRTNRCCDAHVLSPQ